MKNCFLLRLSFILLSFACSTNLSANSFKIDSLQIQVKCHKLENSVLLRWTTPNSAIWQTTNSTGFRIERFTIARGDSLLNKPERKLLCDSLKKLPLPAWEHHVKSNNYAAIVAQALYGDSFTLSTTQSNDSSSIPYLVSQAQEIEQRYLLSMYAADLDFSVAEMAAWGYTDTTIQANEDYLYRVYCADTTLWNDIHYGICITSDANLELPQPTYFNGSFTDKKVLLSWDITHLRSSYVAYQVERSEDSIHFEPRFSPLVMNMAGKDIIVVPDSIEENNKTYYYRLYGVSPFGEKGPFSKIIKGEGYVPLSVNPIITDYSTDSNGVLHLTWHFDSIAQKQIKGFEVRHSISSSSGFTTLYNNIAPHVREVSIKNLLPSNYLVVAAIPHKGYETASLPIFVQMVDSIPPAAPVGLHGSIDSTGIVTLSWEANTEHDIYGYRIFKRISEKGKLFKMNDVAIRATQYTDSVTLNDLNNYVYYAVAAIDKRYNQSVFSDTLKLTKPDFVPPTAPAIASYKATDKGNIIHWICSTNTDAKHTLIYRSTTGDSTSFVLVQSVPIDKKEWIDANTEYSKYYFYHLRTEDQAQNISNPSPVFVIQAKTKTDNKVTLYIDHLPQGRILTWKNTNKQITGIVEIYRKTSDGTFRLWKTVKASEGTALDRDATITEYEYYIKYRPEKGYPVFSERVK